MKSITLSLALVALAFATPTVLVAADGAATTPMQMDCCNTTCPVCDMVINKAVPPATFKPSESVKAKHPGIEVAQVGFCSEKCKTVYQDDPSKYESKITPQWQQWKNKKVKGG